MNNLSAKIGQGVKIFYQGSIVLKIFAKHHLKYSSFALRKLIYEEH
jgi:hypothetical protein